MVQTDQNKILDIARGFYENLFRSTRPKPPKLDEMKNKKAPGDDDIPIEAIKEGGPVLEMLTVLFNKCLEQEKIPDA